MGRPRLNIDESAVIAAYTDGKTLVALAAEIGVDRSVVTRVVKEAGVFRDQRGAHWLRKRQSQNGTP